jgi:hypothetical protein
VCGRVWLLETNPENTVKKVYTFLSNKKRGSVLLPLVSLGTK